MYYKRLGTAEGVSRLLIQGIAGAEGIAIGKAYVHVEEEIVIDHHPIRPEDVKAEIGRLQGAMALSREQLETVRASALAQTGEKEAAIFDAHIAILDDPALFDDVRALIEGELQPAAAAVESVARQYEETFAAMDDDYLRERAADIKDIGNRLLRNLLGMKPTGLDKLPEDVIVIAHDLTPSDTITLDKSHVQGFAVNIGGRTSHAAIIARTLEIPAVLGLGDVTAQVKDGDMIILDGLRGCVISRPTEAELVGYRQKAAEHAARREGLKVLVSKPAITADGRQVEIAANIGGPQDVEAVLANGGDGVGLYRTEFLYMGEDGLPDEEKQFQAYKAVAERLAGKPLIIRTLDVGGDKEIKGLPMPHELNPFLGWRAIRICLERRDIFRTQLRAILRAGVYGNILIMYPMISGVEEVREANAFLAAVKAELKSEGIPYADNVKVGIMVEIPSAAVTADIIAPEVDFFSIGTNDLCQYSLAVDRMNEKISGLYQPLHPAVLRLIKNVIDVSHRHGKFTGMCGELAGEPLAVPILLGLGLDEFSMSASSMLKVKSIVRRLPYDKARAIADRALEMATAREIGEYAAQALRELGIDISLEG